MKFIINPFAEIMIKSKPVRKRYLNFLQTNTNLAIKHIDSGLKASYKWDRGEILIDKTLTTFQVHALKKTLSRIPGIENFIEVDQYSISDFLSSDVSDHSELFHYIFTQVQKFYSQKIENKTFAVRVRRVGKHTFSSLDLEKYI